MFDINNEVRQALFCVSLLFSSSRGFVLLPLHLKTWGGGAGCRLLPLTRTKQNSLDFSVPAATFGILPANKFLASHKVSVIQQETKPLSQPESCLPNQSVSLLSSQPDCYLLSGTIIQAESQEMKLVSKYALVSDC